MSLSFSQVCEIVKTERDFQELRNNTWNHNGNPSVEAEILLMEEYIHKARTAWATKHGLSLIHI